MRLTPALANAMFDIMVLRLGAPREGREAFFLYTTTDRVMHEYRLECPLGEAVFHLRRGTLGREHGWAYITSSPSSSFSPPCLAATNQEMATLVMRESAVAVTFWGSKNKLCLPGGRVERGETPAQACAREMFEETSKRPDKLVDMGVMHHIDHDGLPWVCAFFAAFVRGSRVRKREPHVTPLWMDWARLTPNRFLYPDALQWLRRRIHG